MVNEVNSSIKISLTELKEENVRNFFQELSVELARYIKYMAECVFNKKCSEVVRHKIIFDLSVVFTNQGINLTADIEARLNNFVINYIEDIKLNAHRAGIAPELPDDDNLLNDIAQANSYLFDKIAEIDSYEAKRNLNKIHKGDLENSFYITNKNFIQELNYIKLHYQKEPDPLSRILIYFNFAKDTNKILDILEKIEQDIKDVHIMRKLGKDISIERSKSIDAKIAELNKIADSQISIRTNRLKKFCEYVVQNKPQDPVFVPSNK